MSREQGFLLWVRCSRTIYFRHSTTDEINAILGSTYAVVDYNRTSVFRLTMNMKSPCLDFLCNLCTPLYALLICLNSLVAIEETPK